MASQQAAKKQLKSKGAMARACYCAVRSGECNDSSADQVQEVWRRQLSKEMKRNALLAYCSAYLLHVLAVPYLRDNYRGPLLRHCGNSTH